MGGVTFRHDGARLASIGTDGTLVVWEVPAAVTAAPQGEESAVPSTAKEGGGLRTNWSENTGTAFWSVAFSPDGRQLVTGSRSGQMTLWGAETGRKINAVQRAARGEFLSARFTPNGRWILSASEDCTVQVFDVTTLARFETFRGHLGPIRCLAVSPDSKFVASGSTDKSIKLWDLQQLNRKAEK
jgi:WD40 repeat protein